VGVSANVIRVTPKGPRGEHVHQFEMFAIRKYLVIKTRIFGVVARQLALQWHSVCTQIVVRGLKSIQLKYM